ncbi:protein bunched, class 1/class 3/D/E isoforms-like isoform X5 [Pieris napi]|uniref:protein bunched, class 1/class 3/D/E isoforms isoform X4 n=1 Tax=Pieris rapae TaxID=64459 RepID=UPI001E27B374|nr:protein bunched, class 1/class 3/D/E isoforms isoform X4 [Pieris rapae]XP_045523898.1 protein bunched, class 1/class 3/D/E isoforms isoform X5 [Pieris brassicae]XP_047520395.1 protein bunched, class 1/class 3/D/E isoforms-like isoform X5 [Pieris napi]
MSAATPEVRGPPPDSASPSIALPRIKPELGLNDATLFAVYCFIKNFIGASGTSAVAIDNKIEQAMDLVKSHLMFAVREEVEVLKERIAELMERINQLEVENSYLRAHASQDTLAQLPVVGSKPPPQAQGPQPPVS